MDPIRGSIKRGEFFEYLKKVSYFRQNLCSLAPAAGNAFGHSERCHFRAPSAIAYMDVPMIGRKTIPLEAWTGPWGSRRLRLPDFKTIGTLRW